MKFNGVMLTRDTLNTVTKVSLEDFLSLMVSRGLRVRRKGEVIAELPVCPTTDKLKEYEEIVCEWISGIDFEVGDNIELFISDKIIDFVFVCVEI